jgi:hypothetical protein
METFRTIVSHSISLPEERIMETNATEAAIQHIFVVALGEINTSLQYPAYWLKMDIPTDER